MRSSAKEQDFPSHMMKVHNGIRKRIALSNKKYKVHANLRKRFSKFKEKDMRMICTRPKGFPKGAHKELHVIISHLHNKGVHSPWYQETLQFKNTSPYKIVKKINSNAHVLELPNGTSTSNV